MDKHKLWKSSCGTSAHLSVSATRRCSWVCGGGLRCLSVNAMLSMAFISGTYCPATYPWHYTSQVVMAFLQKSFSPKLRCLFPRLVVFDRGMLILVSPPNCVLRDKTTHSNESGMTKSHMLGIIPKQTLHAHGKSSSKIKLKIEQCIIKSLEWDFGHLQLWNFSVRSKFSWLH